MAAPTNYPLSDVISCHRAMAPQSAGTGNVNGVAIDLRSRGARGCLFICCTGTQTTSGTLTFNVQTRASSSDSWTKWDGGDLDMGASKGSNLIGLLDVYEPRRRWIRVQAKRGTANTEVAYVIAMLYANKINPPTKHSTVVDILKSVMQS